MDRRGGRRAVSVHSPPPLSLTDAGECSGNSGVSSGKNIGDIMERGRACHQLSMRGRGLSERTKGTGRGGKKRHNNQQRINGRDGGKERGGEGERETNAQREGLKSRPIRKAGDGRRKELKGALMRDGDRAPAN